MKTVGIIAEYNPFHNGHLHHIKEAKRLTNANYTVVVMSGDFVQRGTPAIIDKYSRTKMALSCGADLVFELPVHYATATAELFAHGAISILNSLGFIDYICFGSEHTEVSDFYTLAQLLEAPTKDFSSKLVHYTKQSFSYPVARTKALEDYFRERDQPKILSFLSEPNTILGVSYLQALLRLKSNITPYIIPRRGQGYHSFAMENSIASASGIRNMYMEQGSLFSLSEYLPESVLSILMEQENKTFPIDVNDFSSLLYYKLRSMTDSSPFPDISEDLWNRINKTYDAYTSFSMLCDKVKSKNLVYTSICRHLLHILLELSIPSKNKIPGYVRLLGFKKEASHLLRSGANSSNKPNIPIITKVADASKKLTTDNLVLFEEELRASQLYQHICYQKFDYMDKTEYQKGPVIL